jgi:hypothetical protein
MKIRRTLTVRTTVRRTVRVTGTVRSHFAVTPQVSAGPTYQSITLPAHTTRRIIRTADGAGGAEMLHVEPQTPEREWDVFICHATEDKDSVVRELAHELDDLGVVPWLDETVMRMGDSIRQRIDHGLAHSRFGIVVLSHAFFAKKKKWTQLELDALVALEASGRQRILPIWHGLSTEEILTYSPILAGRLAARTSEASIRAIAEEISEIVRSS